MSEEEIRRMLQQAIDNRRRSIADLENQKVLYPDRYELDLRIQAHEKEIARLEVDLAKLGLEDGELAKSHPRPVAASPEAGPTSVGDSSAKKGPSTENESAQAAPVTAQKAEPVGLWLGFLLLLLVGFAAIAYVLADLGTTLVVLVAYLLVLFVFLPFIGRQNNTVSASHFFKLLMATLEKVPALGDLARLVLSPPSLDEPQGD